MLKRLMTVTTAAVIVATATVTLSAPTAAAAPVWCGSWLQNPAEASSQRNVAGTKQFVGDPGEYIVVREGTHRGRWYAWAKLVNDSETDLVALIWVNEANRSRPCCAPGLGTRRKS